jgi:hypothetical protein
MIGKKEPVRVANVSTVFAPPDEVELPLTREQRGAGITVGDIVAVRPLDALGYALKAQIDKNPAEYGERIWELTQACLPTVAEERVMGLTPTECGVIVFIATGRIAEVQAMAEKMLGNAEGATTATPEPPTSPTPSDSSASASGENAAAT